MNLTLTEILKINNLGGSFQGDAQVLNKKIRAVGINSRTLQKGEIFVAIRGERFDGHQFIADAVAKEALACIVAKDWFGAQDADSLRGNFLIVSDTLRALQKISHFYRKKFSVPILAITGSNGKTTTKEMIAAVLQQKLNVLKNPGNLNNHIGLPLTLLKLNEKHEFAITEMGTNHFGEIARLTAIGAPNYGLITNIGPAHLEFFGSLDGVYRAKRELWEYLEISGSGAFVNMDDPYLRKKLPHVPEVVEFGLEHAKDVRGELVGMDSSGHPRFIVDGLVIQLSVPGMHNVYNALAAVAVGKKFGVPDEKIRLALETFQSADKRMEVLEVGGIKIINDCYNSNSASAKRALETLSQMATSGRRIAVLGDMFELGDVSEREHFSVGMYCADLKNIDFLLAVGAMAEFMVKAASGKMKTSALHFTGKDDLKNYLLKLLAPKDLVLIKGSRGMAMEEITQFVIEKFEG
ncbi:MAG: UDP-N-acetylmuramoyl-tripeptide--D-alanyl-D-alanine ligase [Calditrichaeota bacterium]|nr:UDP-N-acetylmuramoyl-tripeptide--D-alanyl-D-alanine ligase [Calditrichota bacterium]